MDANTYHHLGPVNLQTLAMTLDEMDYEEEF